MLASTFHSQLMDWAPEALAGGEAVHAVATVVTSRKLDRMGLGSSAAMLGVEPQDVAELHEQHIVGRVVADARRVAERYVRMFGEGRRD